MTRQPFFLDYIPDLGYPYWVICDLQYDLENLKNKGFIFHKIEEYGLGINLFSYVYFLDTILCFIQKEHGPISVEAAITQTREQVLFLLRKLLNIDTTDKEIVSWVTPYSDSEENEN